MDIIQDYALQAYRFYQTTDPYLSPIRTSISTLRAHAYPLLLPYLDRLAVLAQDSPALLTVGISVLFLYISMRVVGFVHRIMMFWVKLVVKLAFVGVLVAVVSAVVQRGVGRTAGELWGWGEELVGVWQREYGRWEGGDQQRGYRHQQQQGGFARGNGRDKWR